jgi:tetratricopeptide (TPR) repeat protein
VLEDRPSGTPLADHTVALDPASRRVKAFEDLPRYLRWRADPGRRTESETALLAQVGEWIGQRVLGEAVGRQIVAAAPVTVRVEVPDSAEFLLFRPLELAHVDGVPLASRGDVSLVYEVGKPGPAKRPMDGWLRMLALFSLPTEASALALRRERYALTRLVRRLAARDGRAVELQVLQYGVTRDRLAEAMTAGGGPDVLHVSGHGRTGELLLEKPDGTADPVPADQLLRLLAPARERVKLAVVSACESAAGRLAETLGLLGLTEAATQAQQQADAETRPAPESGIAHRVARELDCAVVAMRYPVTDEFAIALAGELYDGLFHLDLPLDRALPRAVRTAAGDQPSLSRPAISIATPTLLGTRTAGLLLTPPGGAPLRRSMMAHFPPEPERFVGRTRVMAAASAALAPDSGHTAVLFHGMAGAGKTACALELANRHEKVFAGGLVFWQAPTRDDEFGGALANLASEMEKQLSDHGFTMVDKIATVDSLRAFLPRLSRLLADNGLLLVLDNLETLLTPEGRWRDPRWVELLAALTGHVGESRVVLTSRIRPTGLDSQVLVEPVHSLSRDESILLARELPHLRELLHTEPVPVRRSDAEVAADRATVTEVLRLVQGHPKLLELADAAAADRDKLATHLATHLAAAQAAAETHGAVLSAFFGQGESRLDADGFLDILTTWTTTTLHTLPDDARLLLQMLCLIEDDDRDSDVVEGNWADLWRRLERPGDPPDPDTLLPGLAAAALIHPDRDGDLVRYRIHPGVAEAVRAAALAELRTAVDSELAAWWRAVAVRALQREGGEHSQTVVYAGLAAAPYLMRLHEWDTAAVLLEQAGRRDQTPAAVQAALPHLRRIADITNAPDAIRVLARELARVDPAAAEPLLRDALDRAVTAQEFRTASRIGGDLANLLKDTGRLREALEVIDRMAGHTQQAGLGPWTQLLDRSQRLQLLYELGQREQVLSEVDILLNQMRVLPDQPGPNETVRPWNVREVTLTTGVFAARDLRSWQQALDLNTEVLASKQRRGAGPPEIARTLFNDYYPLLELGRLDEAEALLRDCQQEFEDHRDIPMRGMVLSARASVASRRDHLTDAVAFEKTALRLTYVQPDPRAIAVSHHNLANHLARGGADPTGQLAHRLAAAVIRHLTGMRHDLDRSVRALARELPSLSDQAQLPASVAELAAQVEQVEGVRFAALIHALALDTVTAEAALADIIHAARNLPDEPTPDLQRHLDRWEPHISALVAAVGGDQQATAAVDQLLDQLAGTDDWGALAGIMRRILAGERDAGTLLNGLDPVDTVIVRATLDRLSAADPPAGNPD